eukprot:TRINITY_DN10696_c0_g1_i1.p1 TRINITY_DN10696_c0_g1~~TRINITY_DN10696_c0_g1_i1.p1  ORF type:complete len:197 (-),score=43.56 TRINITY_DN10696_c0_g1_i1:56-646(-)
MEVVAPYIGVVQLTSTSDTVANFAAAETVAKKAHQVGVQLLCYPECFAFMGESSDGTLAQATKLDSSPILDKYKQLAKTYNLWLSLGGFHELSETPGKIHNTHLVINNKGEVVAIYRKVHMFRVAIEGGPNLDESRTTSRGEELVVVDTPLGRLGLSTCYDLRFPEVYTALRKAGAEILLVPSAFTDKTGQAHWPL